MFRVEAVVSYMSKHFSALTFETDGLCIYLRGCTRIPEMMAVQRAMSTLGFTMDPLSNSKMIFERTKQCV